VSLFRKVIYFVLLLFAFACAKEVKTPVPNSPVTYDKLTSYRNGNPAISLPTVDRVALVWPNDLTDTPDVVEKLYNEIKKQLEFRGYKVISHSVIERTAKNNGLEPMELFHPPYIRKTIRTFGIGAFMIAGLLDYQCEELNVSSDKRVKDSKRQSMCSFTVIMRISDLDIIGEKERVLWSGTAAFRDVTDDIGSLFEKKLDALLHTVPAHGDKAPAHPLDSRGKFQ